MAVEVVPLKVKIGLRPNGHADHPDWTRLPLVKAGPGTPVENAEAEIRTLGGWKYDKLSGHGEDTPGSPADMQFGMLFVSEAFATEAEADPVIGLVVSRMTEAEAIDFWDNNAHVDVDEFLRKDRILDRLKTELDLRLAIGGQAALVAALKNKIRRALDPDDPEPGIKRNVEKTWALKSARSGVTIKGRGQ